MKILALMVMVILSVSGVAMAERDYDRFNEKYGLNEMGNNAKEDVIRSVLFRDPDVLKGKRVVVGGILRHTKTLDNGVKMYLILMRVPFAGNTYENMILISKTSHSESDLTLCVGTVAGSVETSDPRKIKTPIVKEIECVGSTGK